MTVEGSQVLRHTSLQIRLCSVSPGRLCVELTGEVDISSKPDLGTLAALVIAVEPKLITLDLGGVTFIDLGGLRALTALVGEVADHDIVVEQERSSGEVEALQDLVRGFGSDSDGPGTAADGRARSLGADLDLTSRASRRARRQWALRREPLRVVLPASADMPLRGDDHDHQNGMMRGRE